MSRRGQPLVMTASLGTRVACLQKRFVLPNDVLLVITLLIDICHLTLILCLFALYSGPLPQLTQSAHIWHGIHLADWAVLHAAHATGAGAISGLWRCPVLGSAVPPAVPKTGHRTELLLQCAAGMSPAVPAHSGGPKPTCTGNRTHWASHGERLGQWFFFFFAPSALDLMTQFCLPIFSFLFLLLLATFAHKKTCARCGLVIGKSALAIVAQVAAPPPSQTKSDHLPSGGSVHLERALSDASNPPSQQTTSSSISSSSLASSPPATSSWATSSSLHWSASSSPVEAFHPDCFRCRTCQEPLAYHIYCSLHRQIFCERHYLEKIRPRCAACDEVSEHRYFISYFLCTQISQLSWQIKWKHFCMQVFSRAFTRFLVSPIGGSRFHLMNTKMFILVYLCYISHLKIIKHKNVFNCYLIILCTVLLVCSLNYKLFLKTKIEKMLKCVFWFIFTIVFYMCQCRSLKSVYC